jgi:hypothetical protein
MNLSGEHWAPDLGLTIRFGREETLQYDSFVFPESRGGGLQYFTTVPIMEYARQHGYRRALAYVNGLNTRSLRNQRSQGKEQMGTIWTMRFPATQRFWNCAFGRLKLIRDEVSGQALLISRSPSASEQAEGEELTSNTNR